MQETRDDAILKLEQLTTADGWQVAPAAGIGSGFV